MDRQNFYVAVFNAFLGVIFSLLLKGSLLIYVLAFIMVTTIVFFERKRIYEKVFHKNIWIAILGYGVLVGLMVGFLNLITRPDRDISLIIKSVQSFFQHLKPGEYDQAYASLSEISKKNYPEKDFVSDHEKSKVKIQDFRIDTVTLNEFDKKKAVVMLSSSFRLYGQNNLAIEMVKEEDRWNVVLSPSVVQTKNVPTETPEPANAARKAKAKKGGKVSRFFKSIF